MKKASQRGTPLLCCLSNIVKVNLFNLEDLFDATRMVVGTHSERSVSPL